MADNRLIDVHAHYTTEAYVAAAKAAGHVRADGMPEEHWPQWDPDTHLRLMDDLGIERSVLSVSSPGVHFGDDEAARALARSVNEAGAEAVARHPDRFGLFASLPLPDVDGALDELRYSFDELNADGVVILSNSRGTYLGDPRMEPVLDELDRRRAVVFLHPTSIAAHDQVDLGYPNPMMEFLFDTARTVVSYVMSGAAARHPGIRLVVPHGAGVLPLLVDRVEMFGTMLGGAEDGGPGIRELVRTFWFDLAGAPNPLRTAALSSVADPGHLLYGSDYPWTPAGLVGDLLQRLDQEGDADWRARTTSNARRLLARD